MSNIHDDPAALKALQDAIYRDKVLRARSMTPGERLARGSAQASQAGSRA